MSLSGNLSYRNGGETGEVGFNRLISKILGFNGVVGSGDLLVSAQGSPDNTVAVAVGDCIIGQLSPSVSTYSYHGFLQTTGNLTVTANSSGSARIDAVVGYVDLSVVSSAVSENPGAFKVTIVAGTPSGSPVAPSNSAIQTAIGASNPFIVLANIAVANGFSTITSGNITDTRPLSALSMQSLGAFRSWTPSYGGYSANPVGTANYFTLGKLTLVNHLITVSDGTSNSTTKTITLPFAAKLSATYPLTRVKNNGTYQQFPGVLVTTASSATANVFRDAQGTAWTNSGSSSFDFSVLYETV